MRLEGVKGRVIKDRMGKLRQREALGGNEEAQAELRAGVGNTAG